MAHVRLVRCLLFLVVTFLSLSLYAQQTGAISGRVTATDGSALPGVTVEARSNVLPQPRVTVTDSSGDYRLPVAGGMTTGGPVRVPIWKSSVAPIAPVKARSSGMAFGFKVRAATTAT